MPRCDFFLLCFFLLSTGCATMAGRSQIISVDSQPRGLLVSVDGEPQQQTPFFFAQTRDSQHVYQLQLPKGGSKKVVAQCKFRWIGAGLGNAPWLALTPFTQGLIFYSSSLAVDWLTGALYHCPVDVRLVSENTPPQGRFCRNFLVMPPPEDDERIAERLMTSWRNEIRPKLKKCDRFVKSELATAAFLEYNVTPWSQNLRLERNRDRLRQLGHLTDATHAVYLSTFREKNSVYLDAIAVDLHTDQENTFPVVALTKDLAATYSRSWWLRQFSHSVRIMPNAVGWDFGQHSQLQVTDALSEYPIRTVNASATGSMTAFISGLDISNVQDPRHYSPWDFDAEISPSLSGKWLNLRIAQEEHSQGTADHIAIYGVFLPFTARAGIHTPIGAFYGGIGAGPGWRRYDSHITGTEMGGTFAFRLGFDYTAFVTQRVYLRISSIFTKLDVPLFRSGNEQADSWMDIGLGVGVLLPEIRRWVQGL